MDFGDMKVKDCSVETLQKYIKEKKDEALTVLDEIKLHPEKFERYVYGNGWEKFYCTDNNIEIVYGEKYEFNTGSNDNNVYIIKYMDYSHIEIIRRKQRRHGKGI